jgi:lauroyl/myristoyl acyltransferase
MVIQLGQRFYYIIFKNNLVYRLGFVLLHLIGLFLRPFSFRTKFSFGRLIGNIWYMVDFANREVCRREISLALGQTHSIAVRQRAVRLSMANTIAYLCETYFCTSLSHKELIGLVRNPDWALPLKKALEAGRGAIVLTAHFCNMGILCYLISAYGRTTLIAKYQRVFNRLMLEHRERFNVGTFNEYETSYDLLLEALGRNEILLTTIDRPLKRVKGINTPFFGHDIVAPYYPTDISRFSGAPIFLAFLTRKRHRYDLHFEGPFHVPPDMEERESREKYTHLIYSILERYISAYPHEWQWQNKRLAKKQWGVLRY